MPKFENKSSIIFCTVYPHKKSSSLACDELFNLYYSFRAVLLPSKTEIQIAQSPQASTLVKWNRCCCRCCKLIFINLAKMIYVLLKFIFIKLTQKIYRCGRVQVSNLFNQFKFSHLVSLSR